MDLEKMGRGTDSKETYSAFKEKAWSSADVIVADAL